MLINLIITFVLLASIYAFNSFALMAGRALKFHRFLQLVGFMLALAVNYMMFLVVSMLWGY